MSHRRHSNLLPPRPPQHGNTMGQRECPSPTWPAAARCAALEKRMWFTAPTQSLLLRMRSGHSRQTCKAVTASETADDCYANTGSQEIGKCCSRSVGGFVRRILPQPERSSCITRLRAHITSTSLPIPEPAASCQFNGSRVQRVPVAAYHVMSFDAHGLCNRMSLHVQPLLADNVNNVYLGDRVIPLIACRTHKVFAVHRQRRPCSLGVPPDKDDEVMSLVTQDWTCLRQMCHARIKHINAVRMSGCVRSSPLQPRIRTSLLPPHRSAAAKPNLCASAAAAALPLPAALARAPAASCPAARR